MAGAIVVSSGGASQQAWGSIIRDVVCNHFAVEKNSAPGPWHIQSTRLKDLIRPLGYFPSYFVETVMDNRYGTVQNAIPLREMAERNWYDPDDQSSVDNQLPSFYANQWEYGYSRLDSHVIERNADEFRKFRTVLDRIANHAKAIESMKESVRGRAATSEDFAAVLLHLTSAEKRKQQLKPQPHGAN